MPLAPAGAFELFGIKFFEDQSESDADAVIADPHPYTLTVATGGGAADGAIRNASSLVADQNSPASGGAGLIAKAKGDYARIVAALYDQGYYGPTVSILVDGREAAYLAPDTSLPKPTAVTLSVVPGPLFSFGRLSIVNRAPYAWTPEDHIDEPARIGFETGKVARSSIIVGAEAMLIDAWRQHGHPEASVTREVVADHDTDTLDVVLTIDPGPRAAYGTVTVTGNADMDADFIRRQAGLAPGAEYDSDDIRRARERLARLEVFRATRIEAAGAVGDDGLIPMSIFVEEMPLRRFGVGATYSSIDGFSVEAFHVWRNLFGRAERLRLDAKVASIGFPIDTAQFDYAFGGTFTMPGFMHPDIDLVASIAAERSVYDTYTETSGKASLGGTYYFSKELTFEGGVRYERSRFDDDFGTRDFSIAELYTGLTWDNRDDPLNATRGYYVNVTAEPFYEFYYGNAGFRTTAEARTYFSFSEDDFFVLAARAKVGALLAPDIDEVPPDRLFFAGGGGSVRGYPFKGIGVPGPGGTVTGGAFLLEGSLEARVKVTQDIGAVAFIDAGGVGAESFPGFDDLKLGAGIGLRYYTGFGPLRLDLATPLNPDDGIPSYAIYLGLGQAF